MVLLVKPEELQTRNNMANANRKKDLEATQSKEYLAANETKRFVEINTAYIIRITD